MPNSEASCYAPQPASNPSLNSLASGIVDGVRLTAFWAAVALPFLHVPLLYSGHQHVEALLGLVALNLCCLLAGHRYIRPGSQ